ncbi:PQQ-binding-like beta-propeller repeat protein [Streptomyces prunicolor]|uniref:caspase, EACC1-associated type n=1 Tax=Streptomyces prunicolor TaxID=67348 RepID=UPI0037205199
MTLAFAEGHRGALLIGTGRYDHPDLDTLRSPVVDCAGLAEVLRDKEIGGFEVQELVNADLTTLKRAMEEFFGRQAEPDDVRLLYLSCHGILNPRNGNLHFAVGTTDPEWPASTSIEASFVRGLIEDCWARSIVVILDCCFSGRFLPGAKGGDGLAGFQEALKGRGRVVITAGNRTQQAYEGDHIDPAAPAPSRFTGPLIDGLRTGDADLDGDGLIAVRELYDYVCRRLHEEGVEQNPRFGGEMQNDIPLAKVKPKPPPKPRRKRQLRESPPRPAVSDTPPGLPWQARAALGPARQPVLSDGVLVVRENRRLWVVDAATHNRHTMIELKYPGDPAFHGDTVYFTGKEGRLQAADLRKGQPRECRRLTVGSGQLWVRGDVLYAQTPLGHLYGIDLSTGNDLWLPISLGKLTVTGPPKRSGSNLILRTKDESDADQVVVVDAARGRLKWTYLTEGPLSPEWAVSEQGIHLLRPAGPGPGRIVTLDPMADEILWTLDLPTEPLAAPVSADGLLILGDKDHRLVARDTSTGETRWEKRTRGRLLARPVVLNGTLYTADRAGWLTTWRLKDGRKLRSHEVLLSQDLEGHPAIIPGALYVTDFRGDLRGLPAP